MERWTLGDIEFVVKKWEGVVADLGAELVVAREIAKNTDDTEEGKQADEIRHELFRREYKAWLILKKFKRMRASIACRPEYRQNKNAAS